MANGGDLDFDPIGEKDPRSINDDYDDDDESSSKKDKKIGEVTKTRTKFDPFGGKARSKVRQEEKIPLIETSTLDELREEVREEFREEVKKYYPKMSPSVEVKYIEGKGICARLYGDTKNWVKLFTKNRGLVKKIRGELKDALGLTANEIIDKNEDENSKDRVRIGELRKEVERTDISTEVRETTTSEANVIEQRIEEREQENERIDERMGMQERIKNIIKKYGLTAFSILSSVGVIISTIVSQLTSGTAKVANYAANGFKEAGKQIAKGFKKVGKQIAKITPEVGKQLAQILPGMIGAIVSFIFKTAGEALGFLAKNSWLLILFVVTYGVEQITKKKK